MEEEILDRLNRIQIEPTKESKKFVTFDVRVIYVFVISMVLFMGFLSYCVYSDKFKSEVSNVVNPLFNATVQTDNQVNNQYDFTPSTQVYNNYTIKVYTGNCS